MAVKYADQGAWRSIQEFLPIAYRLTPSTEPDEEWWMNRGHRIHLDAYRNPDAAVKVLLFTV